MPPLPDDIRVRIAQGETDDHFLIQGRHAVLAALGSDFVVEAVVALRSSDEVTEAARERGVPVYEMGADEAAALLGFAFHRGVLAIAQKPRHDFATWAIAANPLRLVFLENLADPGNVGTIIRNAAAFGFDAVILSPGGASPYNAKAARASATAIFEMPVFVVPGIEAVKTAFPGVCWIGTDLSEQAESLSMVARDLGENSAFALVFGSEADGLSEEVLTACDRRLRIEISDRVESLNVASASAILLHAFRRL